MQALSIYADDAPGRDYTPDSSHGLADQLSRSAVIPGTRQAATRN